MAQTNVLNLTSASVGILPVIQPTVVVSATGTSDVFENADTKNQVSANAVVKYVNLRDQFAIRNTDSAPTTDEQPGWVEYAVVVFTEQGTIPTVESAITSNIGTQTLGDLCINLYRGKCLWNGAMRISREVPEVLDLKIKIPNKYCKMQRGSYLMVLHYFRSVSATDTATSVRQIHSHQYKVYI